MASELVEYIIDDVKKHIMDKYDLEQNKQFWFKYAFLTEQDKNDLHLFYTFYKTYIEVHS